MLQLSTAVVTKEEGLTVNKLNNFCYKGGHLKQCLHLERTELFYIGGVVCYMKSNSVLITLYHHLGFSPK